MHEIQDARDGAGQWNAGRIRGPHHGVVEDALHTLAREGGWKRPSGLRPEGRRWERLLVNSAGRRSRRHHRRRRRSGRGPRLRPGPRAAWPR